MMLLLTRPFDEDVSLEGYDQAAAWARLVERGLREMAYRRALDLPHREVSLAEALSEPQGARVIPLHAYSVRVPEKAV